MVLVRRSVNHGEPFIEDAEGLQDPVVLQLAVFREQLVLSCFDLWHFVLNNWYAWSSEMDEQDFDRVKEITPEGPDAGLLLDQRMRQSWSAIFQLDQRAVDMSPFQAKSIQGCFWTLRLPDVTAVLERDVLTSCENL